MISNLPSPTYNPLTLIPLNTSPPEDSSTQTAPLARSKRGIALKDKRWKVGSTVTISLSRLDENQKKLVIKAFDNITPHINLNLKFVDSANADIRIDNTSRKGSSGYSFNGTDALKRPKNEPTMGFNFDRSPEAVIGTISHESLHALGVLHEHQHPDRTITFNKEALRKTAFVSHPNPERVIKSDITDTHSRTKNNPEITEYDKDSIMHYSFSSEALNGADAIIKKDKLSKGDEALLRKLYPFDPRPTVEDSLKALNATAIKAKLWPPEKAITVSLHNMGQEDMKFIKHNINKLAPHLPVNLKFTEQENADIRIHLTQDKASSSLPGTDAKNAAPSEPTMTINLTGSKKDAARTVKKLFALAMGLENVKIPKESK